MYKKYTIILDEYQVANLKAMIEAVGFPNLFDYNNPLEVLNSGDWLGEIYYKLPDVDYEPNNSPENYRKEALRRKK